ncbi:hypothetical protein [Streptomyces sp. BV286]|uniref:hypothetical protein n=1 Tax=Streptomyces sp. BV286 TaxID=2849672 RepID=UPI0027E56582|nr:hypothetical protein [Streptomyces sp. BV286]
MIYSRPVSGDLLGPGWTGYPNRPQPPANEPDVNPLKAPGHCCGAAHLPMSPSPTTTRRTQ